MDPEPIDEPAEPAAPAEPAPAGSLSVRNRRFVAAIALVTGVAGFLLGRYGFPTEGDDERRAERALELACPDDEDLVEANLYLQQGLEKRAVDRLQQRLEDDERIHSVDYLDEDEMMAEFDRLFSESPELVESVTAGVLPPSFRVEIAMADVEAFTAELEEDPLVSDAVGRQRLPLCPED